MTGVGVQTCGVDGGEGVGRRRGQGGDVSRPPTLRLEGAKPTGWKHDTG